MSDEYGFFKVSESAVKQWYSQSTSPENFAAVNVLRNATYTTNCAYEVIKTRVTQLPKKSRESYLRGCVDGMKLAADTMLHLLQSNVEPSEMDLMVLIASKIHVLQSPTRLLAQRCQTAIEIIRKVEDK